MKWAQIWRYPNLARARMPIFLKQTRWPYVFEFFFTSREWHGSYDSSSPPSAGDLLLPFFLFDLSTTKTTLPVSKPVSNPVSKPASKSVSKPVSKLVSKSVSKSSFKTSSKRCFYWASLLRRLVIVKQSFTCFLLAHIGALNNSFLLGQVITRNKAAHLGTNFLERLIL